MHVNISITSSVVKFLMCGVTCLDISIRSDEYPYSMAYSSSHFELRRKKALPQPHIQFNTTSPPPLYSFAAPATDLQIPKNVSDSNQPNLSTSQLLRGKLQLHGELIDALHELASQSRAGGLFESTSGVQSREVVLEQALVEQNQILDVMQELISTLESENKQCRESVCSQSTLIQELSVKGRQAEKEMLELRRRGPPSNYEASEPRIAKLKKQLEDKDKIILSLQSRLKSDSKSVESLLMSTRTKLEVERVRCIELEEEVSQWKNELTLLKRKAANSDSNLISKESMNLHLKHEIKTLRNFVQQQQDLVMKQRTSLVDKDAQLSSLTRALKKEKQIASQLRRIQLSSHARFLDSRGSNPDSLEAISPSIQTSFFEQVTGRETCTVELSRITKETELGFSFTKVDLPVSSHGVPCLLIKAVKEESIAAGWLRPGDELIEVNGVLCRSAQQSRAVRMLEQYVGMLKMVVARDTGPFSHSTPMGSPGLADKASSNDRTALWATGLPRSATFENFTFENFTIESIVSEPTKDKNLEYITVPDQYAISVAKNSEESLNEGQQQGNKAESIVQQARERHPNSMKSAASSTNGSESLMTFSSKEDTAYRKLQDKLLELQDQLDESEHIRLNLESELGTAQQEAGRLKEECQLAKTENQDLNQHVSAYQVEMSEIRKHISDLQTALVCLEGQVSNEQQKLASMENLNRVISSELAATKDTASRAVEERENLQQGARQSKAELEQREEEGRKMEGQLDELKRDNTTLVSDVARMGTEVCELRSSLEECKRSSEDTITNLKQEQKQQSQLQLAKEISEKWTLSSQEEYQHLTTQLKSAKSLLMAAEIKESQQEVEVRYLKQAADLANSQLKKLETDYHKTKEELNVFKQQAENRTLEMKSLTVGLKKARMKLEARQEMVVRLQGEVDNSRRATFKLRNESSTLKETVRKLEIELKGMYSEEERLGGKLQASLADSDEMFQQLEKSYEEATELSITVERLTAQVQQLEQNQTESGTVDNELVQSLQEKLQQEVESNLKKAESTFQQTSKLRSEVKLLEDKCASTARELTQLRIEKEQLNAAKGDMYQQLVELQETHARAMEERTLKVNDIQSLLAQTQEQAKIDRQHLDETRNRIAELVSELEAAKDEKKRSDDMVASLEFLQAQDHSKHEQANQSIHSKEKEILRLNEQVEMLNSLLQKNRVEQANFVSANASTRQGLEKGLQIQTEEAKDLRDQLTAREKRLTHLKDELKAQETMNEMLQNKVKDLSESVEQRRKDKTMMERIVEETSKERDNLRSESKQLQTQAAHLKSDLDQQTLSTNLLSSETAGLRLQVRQNEKEIDQVTAQLYAAEMNLEVTARNLKESERAGLTQSQQMEDLEVRYKDSLFKFEDLNASLEEKSMELFKKEDELSRLKLSLELRQTECKNLQESVITLQVGAESLRRSVDDLEEEKSHLTSNIAQFDEDKKSLQQSLVKIQEEKENEVLQLSGEIEKYRKEIKDLQSSEQAHLEEISALHTSHCQAQTTISQLESAQEETKKSVQKLGSEKDIGIISLQEEIGETRSKLSKATAECVALTKNEAVLREELRRSNEAKGELQEQLRQEASNEDQLKEEIEMLKTTAREITGLNEKVTMLSETLQVKTEKLAESESMQHSTEAELTDLRSENEILLQKVLESSNLKLTMAEQSNALDEQCKQLEEERQAHKQASEERDQLLQRVREFEIHNYASGRETKPADSQVVNVGDTAQLLQLVQENEEQLSSIKEYTDSLLINVMMNAPFLLEKLN